MPLLGSSHSTPSVSLAGLIVDSCCGVLNHLGRFVLFVGINLCELWLERVVGVGNRH